MAHKASGTAQRTLPAQPLRVRFATGEGVPVFSCTPSPGSSRGKGWKLGMIALSTSGDDFS